MCIHCFLVLTYLWICPGNGQAFWLLLRQPAMSTCTAFITSSSRPSKHEHSFSPSFHCRWHLYNCVCQAPTVRVSRLARGAVKLLVELYHCMIALNLGVMGLIFVRISSVCFVLKNVQMKENFICVAWVDSAAWCGLIQQCVASNPNFSQMPSTCHNLRNNIILSDCSLIFFPFEGRSTV